MQGWLLGSDACECEGQGLGCGVVPIRGGESHPVPGDVRQRLAACGLAGQETAAMQGRVTLTKGDHTPDEVVHPAVVVEQGPVEPGDVVVLAVAVVVALFALQHLVAAPQHGYTLAQHENGHEVAGLASTQREDRRIVGRAFDAAVPAQIVVVAVAVVLAVGLVVLEVVAHQIPECEAVVAGDEVD